MIRKSRILPGLALVMALSCHEAGRKPTAIVGVRPPAISCEKNIPARFPVPAAIKGPAPTTSPISTPPSAANAAHSGMVWIPGGTFRMGADNDQALADEYPKHPVTVSGFWIDRTEVTNAEFYVFVKATGYITTAEKKPDWNELKQQLPPGTAKPDASLLVAASLVFPPSTPAAPPAATTPTNPMPKSALSAAGLFFVMNPTVPAIVSPAA